MDGLIGLIIFAAISFIYNKVMEKQNEQNGDGADLSQWLEEVEAEEEPESAPPPVEKRSTESLVQKLEKEQKTFTPPKTDPQVSILTQTPPPPIQEYRTVQDEKTQSTKRKQVTKPRRKKRHSLNYKNKKTLRQAFILNTVLSKTKAYEP